jgi:predicted DCC family thiol-disulfide oxidoreductase YuxK
MKPMVSAVSADEHVLRRPAGGGVLVFDGYCGFCTRAVLAVLRGDRRRRVRALPLQGPGVLELCGVTREAAMREAWWFAADGTRCSGAAAMTAAFGAATGVPLSRLLRLRPAARAADGIYRWVAAHRRFLPGATPYCRTESSACWEEPAAACGVGGS